MQSINPLSPTSLDAWLKEKLNLASLQPQALATYQLRALQHTFHYVKEHSPFYRKLYNNYQLETWQDFAALPFLGENDLRQFGTQMLCVGQEDIHRIVSLDTSGTTDTPKRLYFTQADQQLTVDFFHHGMMSIVQPRQKVLILLPGPRPGSVGDLLAQGLTRFDAKPLLYDARGFAAPLLRFMIENQVEAMVASPVQALTLSRLATPAQRAAIPLKSILLSVDYAADSLLAALRQLWHADIFQHYGMTEMGLGGGVDCAAHCGYHLREADLYFEIINPINGQPIQDETEGEIVFSTLTRQAMPLLRYRTGDTGHWQKGPCPCGSDLRLLAKVGKRQQGVYQLPNGSLDITQTDEVLFAFPEVYDYQLTLKEDGIALMLACTSPPDKMALQQALATIPALSGSPITFSLVKPGYLPSLAKRKFINTRKESLS